MRITNNYSPYTHQSQNKSKSTGFSDMLADMAAKKSDVETKKASKDNTSFQRSENSHRYHGTEINPRVGQLVLAKVPCTAELVEDKPFVAEPTYPASINDLSHDELKAAIYYAEEACRNLDKEGMSKGEIYNQMETIFKDFLGKDFMEHNFLNAGMSSVGRDSIERDRILAFQYFHMQLSAADVSLDSETLREAKGYTDMSESEMRAAVREKYPESMSVKDCILMSTELWQLGLEEINYGTDLKMNLSHTLGIDPNQFTDKVQALYSALLDMPADFDAIKTAYANHEKNERVIYPTNNMDGVFEKLLSWFGGSELASSEMLSNLRTMLDDMEKSGELVFDQFGYCRSPEKV